MSRVMKFSLSLGLLFVSLGSLLAQETMQGPPKVLVIIREFLKPGKAGSAHQRTESAFVNAFTAAKWPQHYFAMDSLSGPPRSLFFVGYDSFAAWEKDNAATAKNSSLSAALDHATAADADLLANYESSTFTYRDDQSYQAPGSIAKMRYFEISQFHVKPGHQKDWDAIVKLYKDNFAKVVPDTHWATFEAMYGFNSGGTFIVITPMKSLAEVDESFGNFKKFADALGESGMKKLADLESTAIESVQTNVFQFNPNISYAPVEWIKEDPFWKPATGAKKAPAPKPAQ